MLQDLRFALRGLAKSPAFTAVAILSLALGIGANLAIFRVVDAALLRPLPVAAPAELISIARVTPRGLRTNFSYPFYKDLTAAAKSATLVARASMAMSFSADGSTERVSGEIVSANYFSTLGLRPQLGRLLDASDDGAPGANTVAVLGDGFWRRRFGADPSVIGKTVRVNGETVTIVGIAPVAFASTEPGLGVDVRVPMSMQPKMTPENWLAVRTVGWLDIFGRLVAGTSRERAAAELESLFQRLQDQELNEGPRRGLGPAATEHLAVMAGAEGLSDFRDQASKPLWAMMAAAALVLLIACANLANLMLARAAGRRREIAVRLAIGASRADLIRPLLAESLLLSIAGTAVALWLASFGSSWLISFFPATAIPLALNVSLDWRVALTAVAVSVLTAMAFGLMPALAATRPDVLTALKDDGGGPLRMRFRRALVCLQVALSLLLLVGAGLFVRTLGNLKELDPGFKRDHVLLATVEPALNGYDGPRTRDFFENLVERAKTLPSARSAGASMIPLLTGAGIRRTTSFEGYTPRPNEDRNVQINIVTPGFFETLGVSLIAGRDFSDRDRRGAPQVAVINEAAAKRYWPNQSAVGRHISFGLPKSGQTVYDIEVIGVVRNAKYRGLREPLVPTVFTAAWQDRMLSEMTLEIRTAADPLAVAQSLRALVQSLDPNLPISGLRTLEAQADESLGSERLTASLSGFFGVLAALLSALGLYGVMAFAVSRRTREIGVRMALGARPRDVLRQILGESFRLVAWGAALGLVAALGMTQLLASLLFGVSPSDPLTIGGVIAALLLVALFASYLPARRAMKVDPMSALRNE